MTKKSTKDFFKRYALSKEFETKNIETIIEIKNFFIT